MVPLPIWNTFTYQHDQMTKYLDKYININYKNKYKYKQGSRWHSPIEPMAQENKNWLKKNQIGSNIRKVRLSEYTATPL